jgi:hypothetical protein
MNSLGPGPPATARRSPAISCAAVDVNLQALKLVLRTSSNTATHLALRQTSSALYREALNIVPWRKAQQHGRRCVCTALRAVVHQPADYLALSSSPRLLQQALEKHLEGDGSLTAQDVNLSVRGGYTGSQGLYVSIGDLFLVGLRRTQQRNAGSSVRCTDVRCRVVPSLPQMARHMALLTAGRVCGDTVRNGDVCGAVESSHQGRLPANAVNTMNPQQFTT